MNDRSRSALHLLLLVPLLLIAAVSSGCTRKIPAASATFDPANPPYTFYNDGETFFLAVDVRTARNIGEKYSFLPLQIALHSKRRDLLTFGRESFVLETADGRHLPLAAASEVRLNYPRVRQDRHFGRVFLGLMRGQFPSPPFILRPLDMFPLPGSGTTPRETMELHPSHVAIGFLYFPISLAEARGVNRLLFRPQDSDEEFVTAVVVTPSDTEAP